MVFLCLDRIKWPHPYECNLTSYLKDITNGEGGLIRHKGFPRAVVHSIEKYVYFSQRDCGENKSESERCPLIKRKIAHGILAKKISYTL